jgi:glycosyltransferase involved in cell wall biosynthesis
MARRAQGALYHLHDPELIPVGILLKLLGKHVVYDVHEDVPKQLLSKHWIPPRLRRLVSMCARLVESIGVMFWDGIVAATPSIAQNFPPHKTAVVQNFPVRDEIAPPHAQPFSARPSNVVYVGAIAQERGIFELVAALALLPDANPAKLLLAGSFRPSALQKQLSRSAGWERVDFRAWCGRGAVRELMAKSRAGIVTFLAHPNHVEAQPNKLFEYMSAGIPVIASDFPLWRQIVEGAGCGLLVDPERPAAISEAIDHLINHPLEAAAMGERGRRAVEEKYNWDRESEVLIGFYQRLFNEQPAARAHDVDIGRGSRVAWRRRKVA